MKVYVVLQYEEHEGYGEPISVHATSEGAEKKKLEVEQTLKRCGSMIDIYDIEVQP